VCRRRVAFSLRQNLLLGFKTSASGVLAYAGRLRYGLLDPALEGFGSGARITMSADEAALIRLWQEKRGEAEPRISAATSLSSTASPPRR
jgi:hypothetical protein